MIIIEEGSCGAPRAIAACYLNMKDVCQLRLCSRGGVALASNEAAQLIDPAFLKDPHDRRQGHRIQTHPLPDAGSGTGQVDYTEPVHQKD